MRFYSGFGIAFVVFAFWGLVYVSTVFADPCDYCVCDKGTIKPSCTDCCSKLKSEESSNIKSSDLKITDENPVGTEVRLETKPDRCKRCLESRLECVKKDDKDNCVEWKYKCVQWEEYPCKK